MFSHLTSSFLARCLIRLLLLTFFSFILNFVSSQTLDPPPLATTRPIMDSLLNRLNQKMSDTARAKLLIRITRGYLQLGVPDSQLLYAQKALAFTQKHGFREATAVAYWLMIWVYRHTGRYPEALQAAFNNLQLAEQAKDTLAVIEALRHVMFTYSDMEEYNMTLQSARRAQRLVHSLRLPDDHEATHLAFSGYMNFISNAFEGLNNFDSAYYYKRLAYKAALWLKDNQDLAIATSSLARLFFKAKQYDSASYYYHNCIRYVEKAGFRYDLLGIAQLGLAKLHNLQNRKDSGLHYANLALNALHKVKKVAEEAEAASLLHDLYASHTSKDSAYKYLVLSTTLRDSLFNQAKIKQIESIKYKEALRLQQLEQEKKEAQLRYNQQIKLYAIIGGLVLLLSIAFFLYRIKQIRKESKLKSTFTKKIHQTEMRALRAQMNPHFIFNCLNSINRYIVKSDHRTASSYLTKFSRLIRAILDNSAHEYITLDSEIQTLRLYVEMEVLRFDNVFEFFIEVDESIIPESISIPSMLIQPYVENAIWHGLLHKESNNGKLWIRFHQQKNNVLLVEIEDNGVGQKKAKELRSKDVVKKKSYGMQITEDRIFLVNQLYNVNAKVTVEDLTNEHGEATGTKVILEVAVIDV